MANEPLTIEHYERLYEIQADNLQKFSDLAAKMKNPAVKEKLFELSKIRTHYLKLLKHNIESARRQIEIDGQWSEFQSNRLTNVTLNKNSPDITFRPTIRL